MDPQDTRVRGEGKVTLPDSSPTPGEGKCGICGMLPREFPNSNMEPTPLPADWEHSIQQVKSILRCEATRKAIKALRKLDVNPGQTASRSAQTASRKRPRTLRSQGPTFPSCYAPEPLVPADRQSWESHMRDAVRADHPAAAEKGSLDGDMQAAMRTLLGGIQSEGAHAVNRRRKQAMKTIRLEDGRLTAVRERIKAVQPEHIRTMKQPLNVPLFYCLMEASGCPDSLEAAARMACGFEAVGDIAPSGWWEPDVQPNTAEAADLDFNAWLDQLESKIKREAQDPERAEEAAAVRAKTMAEVQEGLMRGPFTRAELNAAYGDGEYFAMHRFGVWQKDKLRGCDNARTSKHNDCSAIFERLLLERPDFPAKVCAAMAEMCDALHIPMPEMLSGTDDLKDAYRHVGTNAPNMTVVALGAEQGRTDYFTLPGFNFGLKSAVPQFNRVPEAATAIARRLLFILCSHYFDDFNVTEPKGTCKEAQLLLGELLELLGFPFAQAKHVEAAALVLFLGVESHLHDAHRGWVEMCVSEDRVKTCVACIKKMLAQDSPTEMDHLAGKLYFTLDWAASRLGRACLQPLLHHPERERLTPAARASLRFLRHMLPTLRPKRIQLRCSTEPPVIVYTDGCHEGDTMDVGYLVATPRASAFAKQARDRTVADFDWVHGGGSIPQELRAALLERKQQIGQVEITGGITPYLSLPELLSGRLVVHYIDNTSAVAALCKGYSNLPDSARLVHAFHAWLTHTGTDVWFEYVPTKANPSDEPSRDPNLWDREFTPAPGAASDPRPISFPALSHVHDPHAWQMEAERAVARA